ncbi:MAG: hypothetical protein AB8V23_03330 [Candidatus Midichloria sp.]
MVLVLVVCSVAVVEVVVVLVVGSVVVEVVVVGLIVVLKTTGRFNTTETVSEVKSAVGISNTPSPLNLLSQLP